MWKNNQPYAILGMDNRLAYYFCLKFNETANGTMWLIAPVESKRFELFLNGSITTRSMICRAQTYRRKVKTKALYTDSVLMLYENNRTKHNTYMFVHIKDMTDKILPKRGEFFEGNKKKFLKALHIMKENEKAVKNEGVFLWERENNKE